MGYRSTIFIAATVFGIMFSLLYSSSHILSENKEKLLRELQVERENASIIRMLNPEQICFSADQNLLDRYPTLVQGIKMADEEAEIDDSIYGNYYSGVGASLNKTQMLSLMREFDFKLSSYSEQTPNKLFTYQYKHLTCGFSYSDKYYQLGFTFTSLESVNRDTGYVPIEIDQSLVDKIDSPISKKFVHAPFNNTAVFFNRLDVPVTIGLTREDTGQLQTLVIPPNEFSDMNLRPNFNSLDDTAYHYEVVEYPWIKGDIIVSITASSDCMSKDVARSLYSQSDFDVRFPAYLPGGFEPACNVEVMDNFVVEIYVNQTAVDFHNKTQTLHSRNNPYPIFLYSTTPAEEVAGIIEIYAQRIYEGNADSTLYKFYQDLLESPSILRNPSYSAVGDTSYLMYYDGKLSVVNVATKDESYRLVGAIPMNELVTTAQSLFEKR